MGSIIIGAIFTVIFGGLVISNPMNALTALAAAAVIGGVLGLIFAPLGVLSFVVLFFFVYYKT